LRFDLFLHQICLIFQREGSVGSEGFVQFFFAGHTLDTERRELLRDGKPVAVEPQVFDLLTYLLQNPSRVVSKDDLIAAIWGGRIVSDSTLVSRINHARRSAIPARSSG